MPSAIGASLASFGRPTKGMLPCERVALGGGLRTGFERRYRHPTKCDLLHRSVPRGLRRMPSMLRGS